MSCDVNCDSLFDVLLHHFSEDLAVLVQLLDFLVYELLREDPSFLFGLLAHH